MIQQLKRTENIVCIVLVLLVLGLQFYYVSTIQKQVINDTLSIQQESELKKVEVIAQEKKLNKLSQFEKELEQVNSQINGVTSMLPTMTSQLKELIEFKRLMEANGFRDLEVVQLGQVIHEDEVTPIIENQYQLTYTSTYTETKDFIGNLGSSNQLINITSFEMSNTPQEKQENRAYYGERLGEVVESKVVLSTFCIEGEAKEEEVYIPYITGTSNGEKGLVNSKSIEKQEEIIGTVAAVALEPLQLEKPQAKPNQFYLSMWDILVSGQNFTLSGPGAIQNSFTGLRSGDNVYITLTLREDGYDVTLEDENGQVQQNSVQYALESPNLVIDSDIARIQEVMPTVKVYLRNYTEDVLEVECKGKNLDLVTIYNEYDEIVMPGETKGKVRLI